MGLVVLCLLGQDVKQTIHRITIFYIFLKSLLVPSLILLEEEVNLDMETLTLHSLFLTDD